MTVIEGFPVISTPRTTLTVLAEAEVVQAGIDHVFGQLGLHRIMADHMPRNTRSAALLQRLDFEREGYARAYLLIDGKWEDMVLNSLIAGGL